MSLGTDGSAAVLAAVALFGLAGSLAVLSALVDPGARPIWLALGVLGVLFAFEEAVLATHGGAPQPVSTASAVALGLAFLATTAWSVNRAWPLLPRVAAGALLAAASVLVVSQLAIAGTSLTAGRFQDGLIIGAEWAEIAVALLAIWAVMQTAQTSMSSPAVDLPVTLWDRTHRIRGLLTALGDRRSQARLLVGKALSAVRRDSTAIQRPITLAVKDLGEISIRPRGSDASLLAANLLEGHCLPPADASGASVLQVCELGSNVGVGLAVFAAEFPMAQILGVEAHPGNAALARRNLNALGDRCRLVEAAIWTEDDVEVQLQGDEPGLHRVAGSTDSADLTARSMTVETLLAGFMPEGPIDYLHCDIVGLEPMILTADATWMSRVRSIKVQLYEDRGFRPDDALAALRRFGMSPRLGSTSYGRFAWGSRIE